MELPPSADTDGVASERRPSSEAQDDILPERRAEGALDDGRAPHSVMELATATVRWMALAATVVLSGAAGGGLGVAFGGGKLTLVGALVGVAGVVLFGACAVLARRRGME